MRKRLAPILVALLAVSISVLACSDATLGKARRYQKNKEYGQAIKYYKLALDKDPENVSARYGLIETYTQRLMDSPPQEVTPQKAEATMAEIFPVAKPLMSDPNIKRYVSSAYQMVAKRYADEGLHDKAAEVWSKVIEIEPDFAEAHYNYGVALSKVGKYEESLGQFKQALDLNPYFVKSYFGMGNSLIQLGRNEEAVKQYSKALELNPDDPAVHHNLGVAYSLAGNDKKAVEEYEKAVKVDPGYALAYKSLHDTYQKLGEKKKAEEAGAKWKEFEEAVAQARKQAQSGSKTTGNL